MQLYRVKLNEGHTANADQVSGKYLGTYKSVDPALYTKKEAEKKAKMFGGTAEPFGKNYPMSEAKIIQLNKKDISDHVLNELSGREAFRDTDPDLDECMYYGDVFAGILGEIDEVIEQELLIRVAKDTQKVIDELLVLDAICGEFQYVMLTTV